MDILGDAKDPQYLLGPVEVERSQPYVPTYFLTSRDLTTYNYDNVFENSGMFLTDTGLGRKYHVCLKDLKQNFIHKLRVNVIHQLITHGEPRLNSLQLWYLLNKDDE